MSKRKSKKMRKELKIKNMFMKNFIVCLKRGYLDDYMIHILATGNKVEKIDLEENPQNE